MPQGPQVSPFLQFIPLIAIMGIFYFMLIRPQKKQEKERQDMVASMAKNDEVITSAGIHGTVVSVKEKTVILRVDENIKIEFERSAIVSVKKSTSAATKA